MIQLNEKDMERILADSYELALTMPLSKDRRDGFVVKSRNKIKGLRVPLEEHQDPRTSLLSFVKHYEYSLPRAEGGGKVKSTTEFNDTISQLNRIVQSWSENPEKGKLALQRTITFTNWTLDGILAIFNDKNGMWRSARPDIESMLATEWGALGKRDSTQEYLSRIESWFDKNQTQEGYRR